MKTVIISSPAHPLLAEGFKQRGYHVIDRPDISYNELIEIIHTAQGIALTTRIRLDKNALEKAKNLEWIGRLGSGMELIDKEYALERGIQCISTPEGNRNAVGEHTLGLLLNLMKHISKSANEVKQGHWLRNENTGTELSGKTIGIIGFGNTGSAFARLLLPFNVKLMVYDKYKKGFGNEYIEEVSKDQILDEAQIISLHIPLNKDTKHFANDDFFSAMKKNPFFLTTCRGGVTDTEALVKALRYNRIAGAGLDVLENENLASYNSKEEAALSYLTSHPNVIVTPHVAGYTHEAFKSMAETLLQKIDNLMSTP
jgi:D-3-phosphoglycerate dehydrogenase